MQLFLDTDNHLLRKRYEYAFKTLLSIAGISIDNEINIGFGKHINLSCDIFILEDPSTNTTSFTGVIIKENILSKTFQLITCQEEYFSEKDEKDRFLASVSNNNIYLPLVSYFALTLKEAIEEVAKNKSIVLNQVNRKFTVVLSHDVDNITDKNMYVIIHRLNQAFKLFKKRKLKDGILQILFICKRFFSMNNPYWNFKNYMNIENDFGFKSSFYFITGEKGRYGARYNLNKVSKVIRNLDESGWEVGLHTNYHSYNNTSKISAEKIAIEKFLGKKIHGSRNHYLRFKMPDTWEKLKNAGIKYDTTLGYPDSLGFRGSVAFPFYPYNLNKDEVIDIMEIPMPIMDGQILEHETDLGKAWEKIKNLLDETKKVNGTIAVNFHHRVLYEKEFIGWKMIYLRTLKYIQDNDGRGLTGRELFLELEQEKILYDLN